MRVYRCIGCCKGCYAYEDIQPFQLDLTLTFVHLSVLYMTLQRDFYFGKLRDIEITCQTNEQTEVALVIEEIQKILYSTSDEPVSADVAAEPDVNALPVTAEALAA
jgi:hypothetical protein